VLEITYRDAKIKEIMSPVMDALKDRFDYGGLDGALFVRWAGATDDLFSCPVCKIKTVKRKKNRHVLVVGPLFPLKNIEEMQIIVHHELLHCKLGHLTNADTDEQIEVDEREVEGALLKIYGEKSMKTYAKYKRKAGEWALGIVLPKRKSIQGGK
jgi:hypothetical protein